MAAIHDYDGMVAKAVGDSMKVVWGAPMSPESISRAASIAFRLRHTPGIAHAASRRLSGRMYVFATTNPRAVA